MAKLLRAAVLAGAGAFAYGLLEPRRYGLAKLDLPVPVEAAGLEILHLSDTHLSASNRRLAGFLRTLPGSLEREPELVIATGDLIQGDESIPLLLDALAGIGGTWGRFYVLGSHDYYVSSGPAYTKYFSGQRTVTKAAPTDVARLEEGLQRQGWVSLSNRAETLAVEGRTIHLSGLDDPYLKRHRTGHIGRSPEHDLAIGVVHTPDVVSEWALHGFDIVLAGHTHGGQVRIPGVGAVVTNSALPARLAMGATRIGRTWLHVSPGLGTGRYAPIRFRARPEATLLRLVPER